jgi:hypothetical protein
MSDELKVDVPCPYCGSVVKCKHRVAVAPSASSPSALASTASVREKAKRLGRNLVTHFRPLWLLDGAASEIAALIASEFASASGLARDETKAQSADALLAERDLVERLATVLREHVAWYDEIVSNVEKGDPLGKIYRDTHGARYEKARALLSEVAQRRAPSVASRNTSSRLTAEQSERAGKP